MADWKPRQNHDMVRNMVDGWCVELYNSVGPMASVDGAEKRGDFVDGVESRG